VSSYKWWKKKFSLLDIYRELRLDDKLLKVSVMVCFLGENKGSKIHNTIFLVYFYIYKKNKNKKKRNKKRSSNHK